MFDKRLKIKLSRGILLGGMRIQISSHDFMAAIDRRQKRGVGVEWEWVGATVQLR